MKILIISDVHGDINILKKILKENNEIDITIFLGDFQVSIKEQKKLTSLFDYVVQGNCDYPGYSEEKILLELDNLKIFITHGHLYSSFIKKIDFDILHKIALNNGAKLILHGHDHISAKEVTGDITRFNPGSTTLPKGGTLASYGILEIENGKIISLEHILCNK